MKTGGEVEASYIGEGVKHPPPPTNRARGDHAWPLSM